MVNRGSAEWPQVQEVGDPAHYPFPFPSLSFSVSLHGQLDKFLWRQEVDV